MLRSFYRCLLRLHPCRFRQRFADEMLSIFDHSEGKQATVRLLMDGVVSLVRQWTLRPEFWHEVPTAQQAAPDGIPSFSTLDPFRPRTGAMIQGLLLSIALFFLTCFAIRYSGIHVLHVRIPEIQFDGPLPIRPNSSGAERAASKSPALPSNSDRALFMPESEPRPAGNVPPKAPPAARSAQNRMVKSALKRNVPAQAPTTPPTVDNGIADSSATANSGEAARPAGGVASTTAVAQTALHPYVGTYVIQSPGNLTISITAVRGQLMMKIKGQPRRALAQVSETTFVVIGMENCWIEFSAIESYPQDSEALRSELQLFQNGQQFTARRR
jgi:hypothetical protein